MRTLFAKHVAVPLKSLLKREPSRKVSLELERLQWLTPEALHQERTRLLRELLVAVGRDVPFYRDRVRELGADPGHDDPWTILRGLPLMDKKLYRDLGPALASEHPKHHPVVSHTSGTTGERLEIRVDPLAAAYMYLGGYRGRRWWGIEQGDPEFKVWGSGSQTERTAMGRGKGALKAVKEWTMGVTLVSPFFRTDEDLDQAVAQLFRRKPVFVFGYANSLALLAAHMVRRGLTAGPGWPKVVAYTSEMLSEAKRETLRTAFAAPVISEYGSCEGGVMAWECPKGTLHTCDDVSALEILDAAASPVPAGTVGELVVTNLRAHEFPLIRYRQGDLASLGEAGCACGRGLGSLKSLVGRMNDVLLSPSGASIDFIVFDKVMKDQPAIRRFKVVERAEGELVVLCELHPGETWADADRERLLEQCHRLLPDDVHLTARVADRLPPEPSGKFRVMIRRADAARYL